MELKTIKTIFHKELSEIYPKEEIDSFFYLIIEHYLKLERFILALQPNYVIDKTEEQALFEGLSRLKKEEPIQYILGEAHFFGMRFKVDVSVLIPRPETEELVHWIINSQTNTLDNCNVLDIGTGSGCIAIALANNLPHARVYGIDISKEALHMAKENANLNEAEVYFIEADIRNMPSLDFMFDIIVSNPPYVRISERDQMNANVTDYEPHLALFVEDEDPLIFYRQIAEFAHKYLNENGLLFLEINQYLAFETQKLLEDQKFSEIELRRDAYGKERMLKAMKCLNS